MKKQKKQKERIRKQIKQNGENKKKDIIRKQNEQSRELKQYERIQNRENVPGRDINLGRLIELATTNKKDVNGLKINEIKNDVLLVIQVNLK